MVIAGLSVLLLIVFAPAVTNASPGAPADATEAPRIGAVLEDVVLTLEEPPVVLDLVAGLVGNVREYTAVPGNAGIVTTQLSGSELTMTPLASGVSTISVSAVNEHGAAFQEFQVTVVALGSPRIVEILHELVLTVGDVPAVIDLEPLFSRGALIYGATAADPNLLGVEMSGSRAMVTGLAVGSTALSVSATGSSGSALQTLRVQVLEPAEPAPTDEVTPVADPAPGGSPDGGGPGAVDEAIPLVDPVPDGGGQAGSVTADAPQEAPEVLAFLADRTLTVGGASVVVDLASAFSGGGLTYSSSGGDPGVVRVEMFGSTLRLTAVATGVTTVWPRATNSVGTALQPLQVTVQSAATAGGGRPGPVPENPTG